MSERERERERGYKALLGVFEIKDSRRDSRGSVVYILRKASLSLRLGDRDAFLL